LDFVFLTAGITQVDVKVEVAVRDETCSARTDHEFHHHALP